MKYRMYEGLRCTMIEQMLYEYCKFIFGNSWFEEFDRKRNDGYITVRKNHIHIYHNYAFQCADDMEDDRKLLTDSLIQELGIPEERIIKNKTDYDRVYINIKIDKDFIYALVGRLKLLGYRG